MANNKKNALHKLRFFLYTTFVVSSLNLAQHFYTLTLMFSCKMFKSPILFYLFIYFEGCHLFNYKYWNEGRQILLYFPLYSIFPLYSVKQKCIKKIYMGLLIYFSTNTFKKSTLPFDCILLIILVVWLVFGWVFHKWIEFPSLKKNSLDRCKLYVSMHPVLSIFRLSIVGVSEPKPCKIIYSGWADSGKSSQQRGWYCHIWVKKKEKRSFQHEQTVKLTFGVFKTPSGNKVCLEFMKVSIF